MIDRIEEICHGKYITALKCISLADDVFNEHFPGYPIFPGSLILEGLAQLGGAFFEITMKERGLPVRRAVLTIVRELKIRKPASPGDRLLYRADIVAMQNDFGVVSVSAMLDNDCCAEGELLFSFVDIPNAKIQKSREDLYEVVTKTTRFVSNEAGL